jgi:hypothetical protein
VCEKQSFVQVSAALNRPHTLVNAIFRAGTQVLHVTIF